MPHSSWWFCIPCSVGVMHPSIKSLKLIYYCYHPRLLYIAREDPVYCIYGYAQFKSGISESSMNALLPPHSSIFPTTICDQYLYGVRPSVCACLSIGEQKTTPPGYPHESFIQRVNLHKKYTYDQLPFFMKEFNRLVKSPAFVKYRCVTPPPESS